ncbi:bifunctional diaminohydroxyphosphoribosylaminopyrimidine deaminase/5-amino-6-(5-phosphoribosylamino)uracil reductase RibD [Desulfobacterota bacterium AH_259_B03_O07]|nr:bifunctional diaminohydroxyphosphoribosylaminopyrimidine deaminase/5-amino-6-(5-phosphoribosylamino)uracil reductase RibD [Desulfobacterota bacterium AH_259_B03_O07]
MSNNFDVRCMSLALNLAKRAQGTTHPNPLVGAVLVKRGNLIGKGYHKQAGLSHAEIEAILDAENNGKDPKGSTLYVTLEPCCHTNKRTPPCVDSIVKQGISEVIVGCLDPNPKVSGKGIKFLEKRGLKVRVGVLNEKCKIINEAFFKYITTGMPFITLKLAASLDGKIGTLTGDSKWIGSEKQRKHAHILREKVDAIIVGIDTIIRDDPRLTIRLKKKSMHQPIPVVLDSRLRIPLKSRLLTIHRSPLIITTSKSSPNKIKKIKGTGSKVMIIDMDKNGNIDLTKLMKKLGKLGYTNILIEGGSKVAASALRTKLLDKIVFFYSPKIIGAEGISMIGKLRIPTVDQSITIKNIRIKSLGEELMIEGYV